jgi:PAS domain-containing protein
MAQHELELILMRELAAHLQMPIFVVQPNGDLIFFNEPAEALLGVRFDETGPLPIAEWGTRFSPTDADGTPLRPKDIPLAKTARSGQPSHSDLFVLDAHGNRRHLDVTRIPLTTTSGQMVGAAAIFWEIP